jgi:outer membrane protein assembly factor BamB
LVFVGSGDGRVYALDASTGVLVWSYATGGAVESSPAVVGSVVYVGSGDGRVYALGLPPYDVTVRAYSIMGRADLNVPITMDGSPTGFTTPHTFTGLTGTHVFTVPSTNSSQSFKQWNTGETSTTIIVAYGGTETAYYGLPSVYASGVVGITGYKLVFEETLNNSLSSPVTIDYSWSFCADKWNGAQWVSAGITGTYSVTGYAIPALATEDLPYVYNLSSYFNSNVLEWGDWLKVSYAFNWNYSSTSYSIACVAKLNVHPGDIAGAAVTFPYLGADDRVNMLDVVLIVQWWGYSVAKGTDPTSTLAIADIINQGYVNINDVFPIMHNWMQTWANIPPPG